MESHHIFLSIQILSLIICVFYATKKISSVIEETNDRHWSEAAKANQYRLEGAKDYYEKQVETYKNSAKELETQLKHKNQIMEGLHLNIQEALAIKSSLERQVHELREMQKSDHREIGVLKAENEWLRAKQS